MIADCRAGKPEGWRYLVTYYVPVIRWILAHYAAERASDSRLLERLLGILKNSDHPLFAMPHTSEREFVAALRQEIVSRLEDQAGQQELPASFSFEILSVALKPLTAMERQMVWLEGMQWGVEASAKMLNLESRTIAAARQRADELLRAHLDHWSQGWMGKNGRALARAVQAVPSEQCFEAHAFLDAIDGRITWNRKKDLDFHLLSCWRCVDHFCRMREVDFAFRETRPLTDAEASAFFQLLQIPTAPKKLGWMARLFSRGAERSPLN